MSDLETMIAMLAGAGVSYEVKALDRDAYAKERIMVGEGFLTRAAKELNVAEGRSPVNLGNRGLVATFYFDRDDSLIAVGAWR